jgi:hypothetical protein
VHIQCTRIVEIGLFIRRQSQENASDTLAQILRRQMSV